MKRLSASFLLCLAMFALPIQGATAAVMMVCSKIEAVGLSMPERHAAIKAEAEAELEAGRAHCATPAHASAVDAADDLPQWHDATGHPGEGAMPHGAHHGGRHATHHVAGSCSACPSCAASAMPLPEIPAVALMHQRHVAPLAAPAIFASYSPLLAVPTAERSPASAC